MAQVEIVRSLLDDIKKRFKERSHKIIDLIETLEENPHKGKLLGTVGGILIKEIKYKNYRFYFLVDGYKLKVFDREALSDLLIRFVRMSDKKHQQKIISEIKHILLTIGPSGF